MRGARSLPGPGRLFDLANPAKLRHNNGLSYPRHRDQERKQSSVLMIRLSRIGARKQPYYRVVVIEKERARNGRPVEIVGTYNPRTSPASVDLKRERIDYWVSKGAQLSGRVSKIMSRPVPEATSTAA